MIKVLYDNRQDVLEITAHMEEAIKKALEAVLNREGLEGDFEVSVSFVTNEEIKELNREYRNVDSETDVLSFPMNEEFEGVNILGDIVISTQKIIEQAEEFDHSREREMIYLTVHSMLHLLGYDHMVEDEKSLMRAKEKEIMKELNIFK
ncbi:MAG TPA: rRNA maturation RNase YbeY [Sedimentibacter sp.]|jgi:probable rRNA maturation factor|nr:rRNA maturation RNase YbeY [Sedimentibacter sp.]HHZ00456.1 rRNA maturation RNase YbeY [Tissierellia bacterium]HOK49272.1 rRNA maturation RNase YbeY [Sedimentibacter sp.]HOW22013.1 rRNA maturation RNase YbeY [Sedimentibacter sp.]HRC79972.1 rRNA maturation RNase YbeY [Sedimentibacter sp.]